MRIPEGTVLARAKREGWTRQIQSAKALTNHNDTASAITPMEAVARTLSKRKDKSALHLSRYVVDASRNAAMSRGDLDEAQNVRHVALRAQSSVARAPGLPDGANGGQYRHLERVEPETASRCRQSVAINPCNQLPALRSRLGTKRIIFHGRFLRSENFSLQKRAIQRNAARISLLWTSSGKQTAQRREKQRKNPSGN